MSESTPQKPPIPQELVEKIRHLNRALIDLDSRITVIEQLAKQLRHDWASAKTAVNFLMAEVDAQSPVR